MSLDRLAREFVSATNRLRDIRGAFRKCEWAETAHPDDWSGGVPPCEPGAAETCDACKAKFAAQSELDAARLTKRRAIAGMRRIISREREPE